MKKLFIITILIIATGIAFFFWQSAPKESSQDNWQSISNDLISPGQILNTELASKKNSQIYTNQKYGFSFEYPEEMNITEFEEAEGDMVLAQISKKEPMPNDNAWFQIFISPFDEEGPMTAERIGRDLPEMMVEEPQNVITGKDNISALIFFSQEPGMNKTREVWFVHNKYLYQVSTYAELDEMIGKVTGSWSFI